MPLAFSIMISAKNLHKGEFSTPVPFFRGIEVYLSRVLWTIVHSFHCELFLSLITLARTTIQVSESKKEKWKFFKVSLFGFLINVQLNLRFSLKEFFESLGRFIVYFGFGWWFWKDSKFSSIQKEICYNPKKRFEDPIYGIVYDG